MSISILNRGASGGLKPELTVKAPSGSTIDIMQNGIVVATHTLGANETEHTFVVKVGTYTVRGTLGNRTKEVEATIDVIGRYEVTIKYALYIVKDGVVQDGFSFVQYDYNNPRADNPSGTVTYNPLYIYRRFANWTAISTPADLTEYETLNLQVTSYSSGESGGTNYVRVAIGVADSTNSAGLLTESLLGNLPSIGNKLTADVSEIAGTKYVQIMVLSNTIVNTGSVTVKDFWIE